jgi:hypothetical protein
MEDHRRAGCCQCVVLVRWPFGEIINPGSLGSQLHVHELFEALKSKKCHWVVLSVAELEKHIAENKCQAAAGENIYPKCKKAIRISSSSAAKVLMVKSSATWILNHNHCCHSIYMPCNEFI